MVTRWQVSHSFSSQDGTSHVTALVPLATATTASPIPCSSYNHHSIRDEICHGIWDEMVHQDTPEKVLQMEHRRCRLCATQAYSSGLMISMLFLLADGHRCRWKCCVCCLQITNGGFLRRQCCLAVCIYKYLFARQNLTGPSNSRIPRARLHVQQDVLRSFVLGRILLRKNTAGG